MKVKNFRKAMCMLCTISLLLPINSYAKSRGGRENPGAAIFVMAQVPSVAVDSKQIEYKTSFIQLDAKIPQIHGLSNKAFEKELNKKLLKDAQNRIKNIIEEAKTYNKDMLQDNIPPLKFEYLENFGQVKSPEPYLTLEFLEYQYSGGAHGIGHTKYITIDKSQNRIITLPDLFKEESNYEQAINEEINRQIIERTNKGEFFFTGSDGFNGIKENQEFYINSNGDLAIVFNVYEIAPYAAGVVEMIISHDILAPYLK